jgi:hypothetical protein
VRKLREAFAKWLALGGELVVGLRERGERFD